MKKILNSMKFGKFVSVNELNPVPCQIEIAGFSFESSEGEVLQDQIVSTNGDVFQRPDVTFRCGNKLNVSLCDQHQLYDHTGFCLGSLFPDHNLIVAVVDNQLAFFAPICNSKRELVNFLMTVDEFFIKNKSDFAVFVHDNFIDLALWLYKNNPGKKIESDWGI